MRADTIQIGGEYAVKWDYSPKGELPLGVVRARVIEKGVEFEVRRWSSYSSYNDKVTGGIRIEILEVLYPKNKSYGMSGRADEGKAKIGRGSFSNQEWFGPGEQVVIEGGHDVLSPWDEYITKRVSLEHEENEKEASEWELEERLRMIGERLQALGFTVRKHGAPWKKGFVAEADYTEEDGRLTPEALDRLVALAEQSVREQVT